MVRTRVELDHNRSCERSSSATSSRSSGRVVEGPDQVRVGNLTLASESAVVRDRRTRMQRSSARSNDRPRRSPGHGSRSTHARSPGSSRLPSERRSLRVSPRTTDDNVGPRAARALRDRAARRALRALIGDRHEPSVRVGAAPPAEPFVNFGLIPHGSTNGRRCLAPAVRPPRRITHLKLGAPWSGRQTPPGSRPGTTSRLGSCGERISITSSVERSVGHGWAETVAARGEIPVAPYGEPSNTLASNPHLHLLRRSGLFFAGLCGRAREASTVSSVSDPEVRWVMHCLDIWAATEEDRAASVKRRVRG
jgi:hypothetical protein